jgi:integrase
VKPPNRTLSTSSAFSDDNTAEQEGTESNRKSAQQVHNDKSGTSRTNSRFWLTKVRRVKTPAGNLSPDFSIQMAYKGRRGRFTLDTANREAAAKKAQAIFLSLTAVGWEQTIAKFKPDLSPKKATEIATVGEWIEAVGATTSFRPTTFTTYCQCLRQIVAEIAKISDQPAVDEEGIDRRDGKGRIVYRSRFDHKRGGREAWRKKVDAQSLAILTPEAVQRWRLAYISRAGTAPDASRRGENSATALIRNARALFSEKARAYALTSAKLPEPAPFEGAKLEKRGSTRYQSKIDAPTLIAEARAELTGEPFKIFCLGLLCGLRKKEIDALLWSQVDLRSGQIRIEATEHFQPKSEESIGAVDLDKELVALLRSWKMKAEGAFVIESNRPPRYAKSRANYRAAIHFAALYKWLRVKGITARKPLHELRKELGAVLASHQGIFAAQRVLRHAQISTTAAYYTDKKLRITAGLGALLQSQPASPTNDSAPPSTDIT